MPPYASLLATAGTYLFIRCAVLRYAGNICT